MENKPEPIQSSTSYQQTSMKPHQITNQIPKPQYIIINYVVLEGQGCEGGGGGEEGGQRPCIIDFDTKQLSVVLHSNLIHPIGQVQTSQIPQSTQHILQGEVRQELGDGEGEDGILPSLHKSNQILSTNNSNTTKHTPHIPHYQEIAQF